MTEQRCAFESRRCSAMVATSGGFDLHHEWPKFLGGDEHQSSLLTLCPNHHRRQHALIRYLVECHEHDTAPDRRVLRRFSTAERAAGQFGLEHWIDAGAVAPTHWEVDAAH